MRRDDPPGDVEGQANRHLPRAATLGEVKARARELYSAGNIAESLALYHAAVAAAPLDVDARIKLGDCLNALGMTPQAIEVWRAAGWFCTKAGQPLLSIACGRLIEAHGGSAEDLTTALVLMYAAGSDVLASRAARIAPPDPATQVAVQPVAPEAAARRAIHCLDGFDDFPESLHPVPILSHLHEPALRRVLPALLVRRLPHGHAVFQEGEPGRSLFLVASGEVRVERKDGAGVSHELARLGAGAMFGEMALLGDQPRSATVRVAGEADLLEVDRDVLLAIAREVPELESVLATFTRDRLLRNLVATSPLFRPFDRAQQLQLLERFSTYDVAPGRDVIREGEPGLGLYLVLRGELEVLRAGTRLATLRAGDPFGEMALLNGGPAQATVRAERPACVLFLARDYFSRLVEAFPEIGTYFTGLAQERQLDNRLVLDDGEMVEEDEELPSHDVLI